MTEHDDVTVDAEAESTTSSMRLPTPADAERDARDALAQRLLEDAQLKGLQLVGPDAVLAELTKRVLEAETTAAGPPALNSR